MTDSPEYRIKPSTGEHVISYQVFKTLSVYNVLSTLNKMGIRPTKRKEKQK